VRTPADMGCREVRPPTPADKSGSSSLNLKVNENASSSAVWRGRGGKLTERRVRGQKLTR